MSAELDVLQDMVARLEGAAIDYKGGLDRAQGLGLSRLRDVRALLAGGADEAYLQRWAAELTVTDSLQTCLDERYDS